MLLVLAAVVLLWRASMRAREQAIEACRKACHSYGVQLLDDTVSLSRVWLVPDRRRGLAVRRVYEFELSADGHTRRGGAITLTGDVVESLYLPE